MNTLSPLDAVLRRNFPTPTTMGITANKIADIMQQPDLGTIRASLLSALAPEERKKFSWALPEVGSTDQFVATYLAANPPQAAYDPCLYQIHLGEASSLLDKCLVRRDEILGLEGAGLTAALDFLAADALDEHDFALARVALKATRAQASAGDADAGEATLGAQFDIRRQTRNTRFALHTQPGGPLNYRERIDILRGFFADDVRSVYERLTAARHGLSQAGHAAGLPLPPAWDGQRANNLVDLVSWCRRAIRQLETRTIGEIVHKRAFFLKRDQLVGSFAVDNAMNADGLVSLKFTLKQEHLTRRGPHRILNLGVALSVAHVHVAPAVYNPNAPQPSREEKRSDWLHAEQYLASLQRHVGFGAAVQLPRQATLDPVPHTWMRPPLELNNEVGVWQGLAAHPFPAGSGHQVLNTNPLGEWEIWLNDYFTDVSGFRKSRKAFNKSESHDGELWEVTDVVLFMTLASQRQP